jgi:uncharacterized protein YjbI with pentapeptide repeats
MANPEHLELLRQGVDAWNAGRAKEPSVGQPDLRGANLRGANLGGANLRGANLGEANLSEADLHEADLHEAELVGASLDWANLARASLSGAKLYRASLYGADLNGANLGGAEGGLAIFLIANLSGANLLGANLAMANLTMANLSGANLLGAGLPGANLRGANLGGAILNGADLGSAMLVNADLTDTDLTGCRIHGISAWDLILSEGTKQQDLVITPYGEPELTVDDLEVAQFVYLLLRNEKIRRVIDTVGKKGVLLLGRFTEGRIVVLERLREELRKRHYVPIVFNFDKPETKDFTETVRLLAGLSKFVIADVTNPKSTPLELEALVPQIMVPFQPIIEEGDTPFAMLQDLWQQHRDRVLEPIHYSSVDALVASFDKEIIEPAEARFDELMMRKAETMKGRRV